MAEVNYCVIIFLLLYWQFDILILAGLRQIIGHRFESSVHTLIISSNTKLRRTGQPLDHGLGDDVQFPYFHNITGTDRGLARGDKIYWCKDGKRVKEDDRHHITLSYKTIDNINEKDKTLHVHGILHIYMIEKEDFGTYKCFIHESSAQAASDGEETSNPCSSSLSLQKDRWGSKIVLYFEDTPRVYRLVTMVTLTEAKTETKIVSSSPGELIRFVAATKRRELDFNVTLEHRFHGRVPHIENNKCSLKVLLYFILFDDVKPVVSEVKELDNLGIIDSTSTFCLSPDQYGRHKFLIKRTFLNKTTKLLQTKEFGYHTDVRIMPRDFDKRREGSVITYDVDEDDVWNPYHKWRGIFKTLVYSIAEVISRDVFYVKDSVILLFIMFVISISTGISLLYKITSLIEARIHPITKVAHINKLDKIQGDEKLTHHVYISVSEYDQKLMTESLIPWLDEFGLSYSIQLLDMCQGFQEINFQALDTSAACIIVTSTRRDVYAVLYEFLMENIVERAGSKRILVIKKGNYTIDNVFQTRCDCIEWLPVNSLIKCREKLEQWIYSNFPKREYPQPTFTSIMIWVTVFILLWLNWFPSQNEDLNISGTQRPEYNPPSLQSVVLLLASMLYIAFKTFKRFFPGDRSFSETEIG